MIDLKQKILVFIDQPHDQLLQRLRPLLSHDKRIISHKITDRSRKHGLSTKHIQIRGYPTVIFCSTKFSLDEQERTRLMLLSPEIAPEKIMSSLQLLTEKLGDRNAFRGYIEADERRRARVNVFVPCGDIVLTPSKKDLLRKYYDVHHKTLGRKRLNKILDMLLESGLILEDKDPNDRRVNVYSQVEGYILRQNIGEKGQFLGDISQVNTPQGASTPLKKLLTSPEDQLQTQFTERRERMFERNKEEVR